MRLAHSRFQNLLGFPACLANVSRRFGCNDDRLLQHGWRGFDLQVLNDTDKRVTVSLSDEPVRRQRHPRRPDGIAFIAADGSREPGALGRADLDNDRAVRGIIAADSGLLVSNGAVVAIAVNDIADLRTIFIDRPGAENTL